MIATALGLASMPATVASIDSPRTSLDLLQRWRSHPGREPEIRRSEESRHWIDSCDPHKCPPPPPPKRRLALPSLEEASNSHRHTEKDPTTRTMEASEHISRFLAIAEDVEKTPNGGADLRLQLQLQAASARSTRTSTLPQLSPRDAARMPLQLGFERRVVGHSHVASMSNGMAACDMRVQLPADGRPSPLGGFPQRLTTIVTMSDGTPRRRQYLLARDAELVNVHERGKWKDEYDAVTQRQRRVATERRAEAQAAEEAREAAWRLETLERKARIRAQDEARRPSGHSGPLARGSDPDLMPRAAAQWPKANSKIFGVSTLYVE